MDLTDAISSTIDILLSDLSVSIDKVCGALEATEAKTLIEHLKGQFVLPQQNMVMKVYWQSS